MKTIRLLTAVIAASFTLFIGCKKEKDITNNYSSNELKATNQAAAKSTQSSAAAREKFNKLMASLPADFQQKIEQRAKQLLKTHPQYRDLVRKALKLEASECNNNTLINQWLNQQLADWNSDAFFFIYALELIDLPTYYAIIFENSSANQHFGVNGEYTQVLTKTFKDLKRFWNIQTQSMVMVGMHGSMLSDRTKIMNTYEAVWGLDPYFSEPLADFILELMDEFPQYRRGNHPIFTFNAFALQGFDYPYADKIVMGDGILEAFTAIGYGDVAPKATLAHEFGHHIQFQLGLITDENSPEATRRTELMADAYSAYYLSHARGAAMQWKRVRQFLQVFFNIGDCSFTSNGHHGTPTQRMAAAEWGYRIANNAQKQGHILTAQQFTALFEAELPTLVNY